MYLDLDKAKLMGQGPWVKDSAWRVYQLDGKYYCVMVYDRQNLHVMEELTEEITEEEVQTYI